MKERIARFFGLLKNASPQRTITAISFLFIVLAIPLTVAVSQRQQNLEQEAAETGCAAKTDYLKQEKTGNTTYRQCESSTQKPDDLSSYKWKSYDCAQQYGVPAGSMVSVQAPQLTRNPLGYDVPNVACVYTCATKESVASGHQCFDLGATIPPGFVRDTSLVCNPGRLCYKASGQIDCNVLPNKCDTLGAKRCNDNKAQVQECRPAANGCNVWTGIRDCYNNTCVASGNTTDCSTTNLCQNNSVRCSGTDRNQPQICRSDGTWENTNNGVPCQYPLKCDQLSGQCRCIDGVDCGQPTPSGTRTPTPTPTPTPSPSPSPTPSPTPAPDATTLLLSIGLDGLGSTGDDRNPNPIASSNPIYRSNPNPIHKTRNVSVVLKNSSGTVVDSVNGMITFATDGKFKSTVVLKSGFPTGTYSVTVKVPNYIEEPIASSLSIASGAKNVPVSGNLSTGDIDNNNELTILDYNILISCYIYSPNTGACNANNRTISDLTDNGVNDHDDYNLHLRDWSEQN